MRSWQVSMAGLLGLVAISAVGLASLKYATVVWTSIAATVALGLLLTAVLGTAFRKGPERGFWAGFALFGLVYLTLVNWSAVGGQTGSSLTGGLSDLAEWVHPNAPLRFDIRTMPQPAGNTTGPLARQGFVSRSVAPEAPADAYEEAQTRYIRIGNFVSIGRYALCLVFALVGGVIGRHFAGKGARESEASDSNSSAQGR
ncbi:MAG TPA: hypothetical protein VFT74_10395 [Isosphaeraceae bacterium]|nr:hypothetical protein [Isosphaeraceae bacterium]